MGGRGHYVQKKKDARGDAPHAVGGDRGLEVDEQRHHVVDGVGHERVAEHHDRRPEGPRAKGEEDARRGGARRRVRNARADVERRDVARDGRVRDPAELREVREALHAVPAVDLYRQQRGELEGVPRREDLGMGAEDVHRQVALGHADEELDLVEPQHRRRLERLLRPHDDLLRRQQAVEVRHAAAGGAGLGRRRSPQSHRAVPRSSDCADDTAGSATGHAGANNQY